ncbi:hypothetical protein pneo_cds_871 [Pandoravirus neocaledonia]|uniref:Uncharacterized protein n=1 Tax=Pandoravirus neocaledonia TaxID=2107708 RepID=A0A2U7UDD1_9VIRU|nr:hypothetical protein pneo_cds_871 [Pandoravirus neocaledonia]AVK76478.1 hypothetical protein pneo_cds_871 [Pandoravirus neocaledonia]
MLSWPLWAAPFGPDPYRALNDEILSLFFSNAPMAVSLLPPSHFLPSRASRSLDLSSHVTSGAPTAGKFSVVRARYGRRSRHGADAPSPAPPTTPGHTQKARARGEATIHKKKREKDPKRRGDGRSPVMHGRKTSPPCASTTIPCALFYLDCSMATSTRNLYRQHVAPFLLFFF